MSIYDKVPKGSVILSVSQIKTGKSCLRKNYLEKVNKLPVIFAASTTRGSILHEVCERWLLHPEQLKPGTQEFNDVLFPKNWYVKSEKGQEVEIDSQERDWIRYIVPQAINDRKLLREPNREIEWQFLEELIPAEDGKPAVWIVGYVDLCVDNNYIIDHKTCKNFRYTLNEDVTDTKKYIGLDIQLNVYAYYWAMEHLKRGTPLPDQVMLRHIQYGFDDRRVKTAHAARSWESVLDVMDQVKDQARIIRDSRSVEDHMDVDGNLSNCGAYGGCPYQAICGGMEEPEDYKERIESSIQANNELREAKRNRNNMSNNAFADILSNFSEQTKENTKPVVETSVVEAKSEPVVETPVTKAIEPKDAVTKADVLACMTQIEDNMRPMGINENTIPAYQELQAKLEVILDAEQAEKKAKEEAEVKAKEEAEVKAKEEAEAKAKEEAEAKAKEEAEKKAKEEAEKKAKEEAEVKAKEEAEVKAKEEAEKKAKEEAEAKAKAEAEKKAKEEVKPVVVQEEAQTPAEVVQAEPTEAELAPTKDNKTSLRKGFVLLINATSNSYSKFVNIGTIYADVADKVRAHNSELSAAEVHATVIASASDIASKMLVGHCVNAPTMNDVHRDLANELVQYADVVVYGTQSN